MKVNVLEVVVELMWSVDKATIDGYHVNFLGILSSSYYHLSFLYYESIMTSLLLGEYRQSETDVMNKTKQTKSKQNKQNTNKMKISRSKQ